MRGIKAITALCAAAGLAGCITANSEVPEWFEQRSAEQDAAYPSLRDVPRGSTANTNPAHWRRVEAETVAAGQAMQSNPRAQPAAATENPAQFLEEARQDLEETRASHEPY